MVAALRAHPEAGYVVGAQELLVEPGAPLPYWLRSTEPEELERFRHERGTGLLLMRRSTMDHVGLFDETMLRGGEDVDWVFRCADLGVIEIEVEETVLVRRIHGANITMNEADMQRAMFAILRKRAQRRRQQ
jgi:GT2 family glycosyltransferase